MFIEDIREDFYNVVRGKRILVIVNYDIDAVCAARIIQQLFSHDNMITSIVPILGLSGMQRAYNEHREDVKYVLLLNCGGCVDILETLEPDDEDTVFFVCDSHRPFDVCNIFNDGQVSRRWTKKRLKTHIPTDPLTTPFISDSNNKPSHSPGRHSRLRCDLPGL